MATAAAVAAAIRSRFDQDPGVTRIHKLLYYCQGWHLAWTDEPLFDEAMVAWDMGPVVAELWRAERARPGVEGAPVPHLEPIEERTVNYVLQRYGGLWASQLIGETHEEEPWREARARGRNARLSLDLMRDFFRSDPAADQAWFWDLEWQQGEHEADLDIHTGNTTTHLTAVDLLEALAADRADL